MILISQSPRAKAYLGPFLAFMGFLAVAEVIGHFGDGLASWFLSEPKYWVYPIQTVACAFLLAKYWGQYQFDWKRGWGIALFIGVLVLGIWVSPQWILHLPPRPDGFDPAFFGHGPAYGFNTGLRLIRLVVVVPLLEEIFWRGFLMRYVIKDPFDEVPFGEFQWGAFLWVTVLFALAHWGPDFWAALVTGALYNWVAIRTRSLGACVIAHALTNLLLGVYIFQTGQWGFW